MIIPRQKIFNSREKKIKKVGLATGISGLGGGLSYLAVRGAMDPLVWERESNVNCAQSNLEFDKKLLDSAEKDYVDFVNSTNKINGKKPNIKPGETYILGNKKLYKKFINGRDKAVEESEARLKDAKSLLQKVKNKRQKLLYTVPLATAAAIGTITAMNLSKKKKRKK